MGLTDFMDNLEVVNSDDLAAMQTAQNAVNSAAVDVHRSVQASDSTPSKLPADSMDSSVIDNAMLLVKEVQGTQVAEGNIDGSAEEAVEEVEEVQTSPDATQQPKLSKYQQRVQQLVSERNEERQARERERQEYQARMTEMQSIATRQNAEYQREQTQFQREQLELLRRREAMAEEANLAPEDKARRKFKSELAAEVAQEFAPRLNQQEQVIRALVEDKQRYKAAYEAKQRLDRVAQATRDVMPQIMDGYDKPDAEALMGDFDEMYMTWCAANNVHPTQGVSQFKQLLGKVAKAEMKAISKRAGAKVQQSQSAPRPAPNARTGSGSTGAKQFPAWADLRADGRFENYVQWQQKGSPPLNKRG
jgi:hypothetical protein